MLYSTAQFTEKEGETSGYYDIYRKLDGDHREILEISIPAEKIEYKKYGTIIARKVDGTYSIYACPWVSSNEEQKFGRLRFFIGGILEFQVNGTFLVYKTDEGWFFLVLTRAFWNIDNDDILEKRCSMVPKFAEKSEDALKLKELNDEYGRMIACIACTRNKKFLLFEGERFYDIDVPMYVYDEEEHQHLNFGPSHGEFIEIQNYEPIEGFGYSIKVYPSEKEEFYIGSILSRSECKQPEVLYTKIINMWKAKLGRYLLVLNTLGKKSLIYIKDGCSPRVVKEDINGEVQYTFYTASRNLTTIKEGRNCRINKQTLYYTYFSLIEGETEIELCDTIKIWRNS